MIEEVAMMIFAILSVLVTAFCIWVLPALAMEVFDRVLPLFDNIPMTWTVTIPAYFYNVAANIHDYLVDKDEEIGRHRKIDNDPDFFTNIVMEVREINEGRRMPVSING